MTDTIDVAALVERLRFLVSLNEPQNGGPYQGYAAQKFIETANEAATALQSQADALAANETELDLLRKRVDGLLGSLATMREALEEIAHSAETHSHVIVVARAALAREGK